jgi:hypothetical protein
VKKELEEEDRERRKYFLIIQGMRRKWRLERSNQLINMVTTFISQALNIKVNLKSSVAEPEL